MQVSSTEVQNNFGKYLQLCKTEDVIITKNGKQLALLSGYSVSEVSITYGTSPKQEGLVTYRQFLKIIEESENRYELIDGKVYCLSSPSFVHQEILGILYVVLWEFFKDRKDCDPFLSPLDIELVRQSNGLQRNTTEYDINIVQPDLMVLCDYYKDIDSFSKYKGTPSLVIEILSNSTRTKDQVKKLDLYMASGIDEFWIVDPINRLVQLYYFKHNELDSYCIYMQGQTIHSIRFPGLDVGADALFTSGYGQK